MVKRMMMHSFQEIIGDGYIFDGTVLFSMNRLPEVGRNYFDPAAAVFSMKSEYRMQLWPGYITSIRQHEKEVLMCAEITHKVMRCDTVLDQLTECLTRSPNHFQRVFKQNILGTIVLTEYNNKTYRVDNVDFSVTPMSKFNMKDDVSVTYMDYYSAGHMVVGFDVYHDTSQRGTSIGALVASLNKPLTCYYSSVSYHRTDEELSNELPVNITKAIHKFRSYNNGKLPQKIVIYRDGVGEGQVTYVFQHEVELLKQRLSEFYKDAQLHMAFILITKRINTRFFADGQNPLSGTVVDDVITLPNRYDFFLVSQTVRQGTVSPTSYNVIFDNLGLTPDRLQRLTYKLTHLYFNWSGTVRVPAPCQYAHKLAYLVGQAIHKSPNPKLDELLYFLLFKTLM